ncbi:MAG: DUF3109 family protein [Balneolaceae bacterium]|nr:DUF3109 family protein [Balneolaceae bacterium]
MFRVENIILSDDIATARFACDLNRCQGACCVVGKAGAPVEEDELPVLRKAYRNLKENLRPKAVAAVENQGLVKGSGKGGYKLNCVESGECVFVIYNNRGVATCAIQNAYEEGRFNWEKPMSCHLFPIRLKSVAGLEYANYEYVPSLCSAACSRGKREGIWLSDFLEKPLVRRYGMEWYSKFLEACNEIRANNETVFA